MQQLPLDLKFKTPQVEELVLNKEPIIEELFESDEDIDALYYKLIKTKPDKERYICKDGRVYKVCQKCSRLHKVSIQQTSCPMSTCGGELDPNIDIDYIYEYAIFLWKKQNEENFAYIDFIKESYGS